MKTTDFNKPFLVLSLDQKQQEIFEYLYRLYYSFLSAKSEINCAGVPLLTSGFMALVENATDVNEFLSIVSGCLNKFDGVRVNIRPDNIDFLDQHPESSLSFGFRVIDEENGKYRVELWKESYREQIFLQEVTSFLSDFVDAVKYPKNESISMHIVIEDIQDEKITAYHFVISAGLEVEEETLEFTKEEHAEMEVLFRDLLKSPDNWREILDKVKERNLLVTRAEYLFKLPELCRSDGSIDDRIRIIRGHLQNYPIDMLDNIAYQFLFGVQ